MTVMKPWAVMCCGCRNLLCEDGSVKPIFGGTFGGAFSLAHPDAASFSTHEEADASAKAFGWSVRNAKGEPDHRCPDCQKKEAAEAVEAAEQRVRELQRDDPPRRGAYVNLLTGEVFA